MELLNKYIKSYCKYYNCIQNLYENISTIPAQLMKYWQEIVPYSVLTLLTAPFSVFTSSTRQCSTYRAPPCFANFAKTSQIAVRLATASSGTQIAPSTSSTCK